MGASLLALARSIHYIMYHLSTLCDVILGLLTSMPPVGKKMPLVDKRKPPVSKEEPPVGSFLYKYLRKYYVYINTSLTFGVHTNLSLTNKPPMRTDCQLTYNAKSLNYKLFTMKQIMVRPALSRSS